MRCIQQIKKNKKKKATVSDFFTALDFMGLGALLSIIEGLVKATVYYMLKCALDYLRVVKPAEGLFVSVKKPPSKKTWKVWLVLFFGI